MHKLRKEFVALKLENVLRFNKESLLIQTSSFSSAIQLLKAQVDDQKDHISRLEKQIIETDQLKVSIVYQEQYSVQDNLLIRLQNNQSETQKMVQELQAEIQNLKMGK